MATAFKHHDTLRLFVEISRFSSFSKAASALNMTKGAISYQMKVLEQDLGLKLFDRHAHGTTLTSKGRRLVEISQDRYRAIETNLAILRGDENPSLTIGMSSYFASRWLSPRLMTFMQEQPDIQLRIQPMTQLFDLDQQGVDLAIRWGNGIWDDVEITPFMTMPAWPTGNSDAAEKVRQVGLARAFSEFTLLRDHDDSNAWSDWFKFAGLPQRIQRDTLIIPDPNVRVQAVIDGQGIALNDELTAREIEQGQLIQLSEIQLTSYGYFLALPPNRSKSVACFVDWLLRQ